MKVQKGNPELNSQCEVILGITIPKSFIWLEKKKELLWASFFIWKLYMMSQEIEL